MLAGYRLRKGCLVALLVLAGSSLPAEEQRPEPLMEREYALASGYQEMVANWLPEPVADPPVPVDPFAPGAKAAEPFAKIPIHSVQEVLKVWGATFPPGSSATLDPVTGKVLVKNTEANHELIAGGFAAGEKRRVVSGAVVIQVIEAPVELVQRLRLAHAQSTNHAAMQKELVRDPSSEIVFDGLLAATPGYRALLQSLVAHTQIIDGGVDKNGRMALLYDQIPLGVKLECDPFYDPNETSQRLDYALSMPVQEPMTKVIKLTHPITGKTYEVPLAQRPSDTVCASARLRSGNVALTSVEIVQKGRARASFLRPVIIPLPVSFGVKERAQLPVQSLPPGWKCCVFPVPAHLGGEGHDLRKHGESARSFLLRQGVKLPASAQVGAAENGKLMVSSDLASLEQVAALLESVKVADSSSLHVTVTLNTLEGPAEEVRELMTKCAESADAGIQLQAALQKAGKDGWSAVDTVMLESRSGEKAQAKAVFKQGRLAGPETDKEGKQRLFKREEDDVGSDLSVTPVISANRHMVEINFSYALSPALLEPEPLQLQEAGSSKPLQLLLPKVQRCKVETLLRLNDGGTCLAAVWTPPRTKDKANSVLQAVFVSADIAAQVPEINRPPEFELVTEKDADSTLRTRCYHISPDFFLQPMAGRQPPNHAMAKEALMAQGVTFPEGSYVAWGVNGDLIMKNTAANFDVIESVLMPMCILPSHKLRFQFTTYEAPEALVRLLMQDARVADNHESMFQLLSQEAIAGRAKIADLMQLDNLSGQRASHESGVHHDFLSKITVGQDGHIGLARDEMRQGTSTEIESFLNSDRCIHLTDALTEAPLAPITSEQRLFDFVSGQELVFPLASYYQTETLSSRAMLPHTTRLCNVWRPMEPGARSQHVLRVRFVRAEWVSD